MATNYKTILNPYTGKLQKVTDITGVIDGTGSNGYLGVWNDADTMGYNSGVYVSGAQLVSQYGVAVFNGYRFTLDGDSDGFAWIMNDVNNDYGYGLNTMVLGSVSARFAFQSGEDSSPADLYAGTFNASSGFSGSGAGITALNASNIASGTVPTARLGSGTANNTTFLRGDNTWQTITSGMTNPMTTLGDTIYGATAGAATRLAGNTTTTQKFLGQVGTGSASAAPTWFDLFAASSTWTGVNYFNNSLKVLNSSTTAIIGDVTGNSRGSRSLDLQPYRAAATQVANGAEASAVGVRNTASGANSGAFGWGNTATMLNDNAFGYQNTASGSYSTAVGGSNTASGYVSTASGYHSTASGRYATAIGREAKASGDYSVCIGAVSEYFADDCKAEATNSVAIGYKVRVQSTASNSVAIGASVDNSTANSVEIGPSNTVKIQFDANGLRPLGSTYKSADGSAGLSVTITTAKLTAIGTNGSMTFKNGILTAQTAAT